MKRININTHAVVGTASLSAQKDFFMRVCQARCTVSAGVIMECVALLLPRGFSRSQNSNERSSFGQCKIYFNQVLIRKKLFHENYKTWNV